MRDYNLITTKILKRTYEYYQEAQPGPEKDIFKSFYKMMCDIIKYNDKDFECSINNITVALSAAITQLTLELDQNPLVGKMTSLLEIILEICPEPPENMYEE